MIKVKHARTADCVVAGFRLHKSGRTPSDHCCSGSYDEADGSSTSASPRRSRW